MRKVIINICTLACVWLSGFASSSGGRIDLRDKPLYLPSYDGLASMVGVTGSVKLRVRFLGGKVRFVERVSNDLVIPPLPGDSRNLVSLIEDKLINAVKRWDCIFLESFDVQVVFELRQAELPGNQRSYLVEYDQRGITTRVVITDPVSSRELGKETTKER